METSIVDVAIPLDTVVVGIDRSPGSDRALAWAVEQTVRDGRQLALVHGLDERGGRTATAHPLRLTAADDVVRADAAALVDHARRRVAELAPGITVQVAISSTSPSETLVELSRHASLVVVGSRGRGPVRSRLLGSVGVAIARRTACPVVVVREGDPEILRQGVLVAGDHSGRSFTALEFAYREASLHQLPLRILSLSGPGRSSSNDEAMSVLDARFPDVRTTAEATQLPPDLVLIERSPWMDLVVVPSGSIADSVLEQATCPVAVVPVRSGEFR